MTEGFNMPEYDGYSLILLSQVVPGLSEVILQNIWFLKVMMLQLLIICLEESYLI